MDRDDRNKPLREDVRLLGELLGDTLRTHEGVALFERVERVRAMAKRTRDGSDADFDALAAELSAMPVGEALPIARAFAHFLNLANIAEQHHRIRRRRVYQRDPNAAPQRGSCEDVFPRLVAGGISPEKLHSAVCSLRIELVLTAHPTEISRRTLVHKHNRIAELLAERDRPDLTRPEQEQVVASLRREIGAAWGTSEIRRQRPTPTEEVRGSLALFEDSLWHALPRYLRAVDRALRQSTGRGLPPGSTPIRFGSWIGGDRDGNPNVTAQVTRQACLLTRSTAASLYLADIDALREELSLEDATPELRSLAGDQPEPYRALLRDVRRRMAATQHWIQRSLSGERDEAPAPDLYMQAEAFDAALRLCDDSLRRTGYAEVADGRLADVLRRVDAFGMTLVRLDIRQEASRHAAALDLVTRAAGLGSYLDLNEDARMSLLLRELEHGRLRFPADIDPESESRDDVETFRTIARIPSDSLGAYVITMARSAMDVLAVELLQMAAGAPQPVRVVPLFETERDLRNAGATLDALFAIPWYLDRIKGHQEVMIGYSDSAKEIGRLAAAWELYKAQEDIIRVCRRHGIQVTLFHGRGGTVARGGGPTYQALQSQPSGSIDGSIRVTEQGEMLQALFGLPEIAVRTLEVYTSGVLESWLAPSAAPPGHWRSEMDRLSDDARAGYRGVVYDTPGFIEYFRAATPVNEIGEMKIGSRPARRKKGDGIESLRAIPWQFAWTQTRLLLGGWLGVEEALERAASRGEHPLVRTMYREWPFFRSVIDLTEMVLAKTDGRIAREYDRRLVPVPLHPIGGDVRARLQRAIRAIIDVTGSAALLESNPVLRRSIDVRNPYVDPINLVQIELLRRLRNAPDPCLDAAFMVTVNGIAAGMRNTG